MIQNRRYYENPDIRKAMLDKQKEESVNQERKLVNITLELPDPVQMVGLFWSSPFALMIHGDLFYKDDDIFVPLTEDSIAACQSLAKENEEPLLDFIHLLNPATHDFVPLWDGFFSNAFHSFIYTFILVKLSEQVEEVDLIKPVTSLWDAVVAQGYAELAMNHLYDDFEQNDRLKLLLAYRDRNTGQ